MARALQQVIVYAIVVVTALINAGVAGAFTTAVADGPFQSSYPAAIQTLATEMQDLDGSGPDSRADRGGTACDGLCAVTVVPCGAACSLIAATAAKTAGLSIYGLLKFPVTARFSRGLDHDLDPGPPKTGA
ncbi:hypothetical protein [Algihabitans sp.]|uniref:hypothetical protein n=1 Tax=Algihabitans sp. TaxID=2821514 RepID=UPI003BACD7A3